MLIKVLRVFERCGTCGTFASRVDSLRGHLFVCGGTWALLAAVRWRLFYAMDRGKVTLEDICTIETLLRG